jgi:hypothetical protein
VVVSDPKSMPLAAALLGRRATRPFAPRVSYSVAHAPPVEPAPVVAPLRGTDAAQATGTIAADQKMART